MAQWRDGGRTVAPHRSGGKRPPHGKVAFVYLMLVRWPVKIPAGKISNGIQDNTDLYVTLAAAAGIPDIVNKLKVSNKVHIDGVNNLSHWTGDAPSARNVYLYYNEAQVRRSA